MSACIRSTDSRKIFTAERAGICVGDAHIDQPDRFPLFAEDICSPRAARVRHTRRFAETFSQSSNCATAGRMPCRPRCTAWITLGMGARSKFNTSRRPIPVMKFEVGARAPNPGPWFQLSGDAERRLKNWPLKRWLLNARPTARARGVPDRDRSQADRPGRQHAALLPNERPERSGRSRSSQAMSATPRCCRTFSPRSRRTRTSPLSRLTVPAPHAPATMPLRPVEQQRSFHPVETPGLGSRTRQELAHATRSCEHRSTWAGPSGGTGAGTTGAAGSRQK